MGLVLVGRAIPLAPYFLAASRDLGQRGLGRGRGRCRLVRAMAEDPEDGGGRVVFDGAADLLAPAVPVWSWDAVGRGASGLAGVHCGTPVHLDARALLAGTSEVRVVASDLRWHDWERYSARQQTRMALGGFVGRITFAGPLGPWVPLLKLGEVLHVGKGTAFGLGKYRLNEEP